MAFNQVNARQMRNLIITNMHIANDAAINESKLDIDWEAHAVEVLASKLLVDYVQLAPVDVSNLATSTTMLSDAEAANDDDSKGIVVHAPKNKVIVREYPSLEPVTSPDGTEVYGRVTYDSLDVASTKHKYVIKYFFKNSLDVEKPFTFSLTSGPIQLEQLYPERFDLNTISDMFAANERFVDGTADVGTRLDLQQMAKDAFGVDYELGRDGTGTLAKSLAEMLEEETAGVTNPSVKAKTIIDEVFTARSGEANLNARLDRMQSEVNESGSAGSKMDQEIEDARGTELTLLARLDKTDASIVSSIADSKVEIDASIDALSLSTTASIETLTTTTETLDDARKALDLKTTEAIDNAATVTDTKIQDVKDESLSGITAANESIIALSTDLASVDSTKGASLIGLEDSSAFFTSTTVEGALAELKVSVDATDEVVSTLSDNLDQQNQFLEMLEDMSDVTASSINDALVSTEKSKTFETLVERLEDIEALSSSATGKEHKHYKEGKKIGSGDPLINTARYDLVSGTFTFGNDSVDVYINGMLQMNLVHYTEVKSLSAGPDNGIAISFSPEVLSEGDVIQVLWHK